MTGDVLVVAAESRELSALAKRPHPGLVLAAKGPGPALVAEAISGAAGRTTIRALVSTGFCGGLKPELAVGDILVADCVLDTVSGERFPAVLPPVRPASRIGLVVSSDRVAVTREEKQQLRHATGASAVEMEAAEVARWAKHLNVPFYCIRAVSDTSDQDLGVDFNAFRDRKGRFSRVWIALAMMRGPGLIPALHRIARDTRIAAEKLGDYLANCRF